MIFFPNKRANLITDYDEFKRLLKEAYPNTTEGVDGVLFLTMDSISISIVPVPSDSGAVMFRLKVLELKDIGRPGDLPRLLSSIICPNQRISRRFLTSLRRMLVTPLTRL